MTRLKPIETVYNGYRFRSRLEARWAVFYDHLGVAYRYEPEGFDLAGERYLPDFWLPDLGCWVEVKGQPPTDVEQHKAELLAAATGRPVYVFYGDCWVPRGAWLSSAGLAEVWGPATDEAGEVVVAWDDYYCWCECPTCGRLGIQFEGRGNRICRHDPADDWGHSYDSPRLRAAYTAARGARFEHGERPTKAVPR